LVGGTKGFGIPHPTEANKTLIYAAVESPYIGVQLTGKDKFSSEIQRIDLPKYINNLIHPNNITIQITPINHHKSICVKNVLIEENYFEVSIDRYDDNTYEFYWTLNGERKDVPKLLSEIETSVGNRRKIDIDKLRKFNI